MPPNSEFHDLKRIALIDEIAASLGSNLSIVTRPGWACLWLSDIEKLEILKSRDGPSIYAELMAVDNLYRLVSLWQQKPGSKPPSVSASVPQTPTKVSPSGPATSSYQAAKSTTVSAPSTPPRQGGKRKRKSEEDEQPEQAKKRRSEVAKKLCLERDKQSCVLTGIREITEVAHLYPFSLGNPTSSNLTAFWSALSMFWTAEKVARWKAAAIEGANGTDNVWNLICFSPNAHKLHTKGLFALEPRPRQQDDSTRDKTCMTMTFYWLKPGPSTEGIPVAVKPDLPEDQFPAELGVGLHDIHTNRRILSKDKIELTTPDPENLPLPHQDLLELQWLLNRVTALSAGAEPMDLLDESDDDDDSWRHALPLSSRQDSYIGLSSPPSALSYLDNKLSESLQQRNAVDTEDMSQ